MQYQQIADSNLENLSITLSAKTLRPCYVSESVNALMGYRSTTVCLQSFSEFAHFKDYNCLQLMQLARLNSKPPRIAIQNRDKKKVAEVSQMKFGSQGQLELVCRAYAGERESSSPGTETAVESFSYHELATDRLMLSRDCANKLGVSNEISFSAWLGAIVPAYSARLKYIIHDQNFPDEHSFYYQIQLKMGK